MLFGQTLCLSNLEHLDLATSQCGRIVQKNRSTTIRRTAKVLQSKTLILCIAGLGVHRQHRNLDVSGPREACFELSNSSKGVSVRTMEFLANNCAEGEFTQT